MKTPLILFSLIVLVSCSQAPIKSDPVISPESSFSVSTQTVDQSRWGRVFNDKALSSLLESAIVKNHNLQALRHRVKQAQANAGKVSSNQAVHVDGVTTGMRSVLKPESRDSTRIDSLAVGVNLGYDLDAWGSLAMETQRAEIGVEIAEQAVRAAQLSLTASITSLWYQAAEQQRHLEVLDDQIATSTDFYNLIVYRFKSGLASSIDFTQQKQSIEALEGEKFVVGERLAMVTHQIAFLIGSNPSTFSLPENIGLPEDAQVVLSITPHELIENRPDLKAAYYAVEQADLQLAIAINDSLPKFSFSSSASSIGTSSAGLFNTWLVDLALNVMTPILDGGRREAEEDRSREVVFELSQRYASDILIAISQVEDGISQIDHRRAYLASKYTQMTLSKESLHQMKARYKMGTIDFLRVLTMLLADQNLGRDIVRAEFSLIQSQIALLDAMAGTGLSL